MRTMIGRPVFLIGIVVVVGGACAPPTEGPEAAGAKATLSFSEESGQALSVFAATTFKMKLLAAYLAEDLDENGANIGLSSMIYVNPECNNDLRHCDVSTGDAGGGEAVENIVETFFDFSPGVDVNAALGAQALEVAVGTYKYSRLEFCKQNEENVANVIWGGAFGEDTVPPTEFERNACTYASAEMNPPLEVAEGDNIAVTLACDLSSSVFSLEPEETPQPSDHCVTVNATKYCFQMPNFVPSASNGADVK